MPVIKLALLWLLLAALVIYIVAGRVDVPFHGDESMQIYMSHDYATLIQQRDLSAVLYRSAPSDDARALDQSLRMVNGTVNKMTIGLAWDLGGYTASHLNQRPWFWGLPDEWTWNSANGSLPAADLLRVARLPSALFTALSVCVVFAIAWAASRQPLAASAAALVYATHPVVLVNGRRAMMEGSFLFFSALVALVAAIKPGRYPRLWILALGLAAGCAVASKHTAALPVAVIYLALVTLPRAEDTPGLRARLIRLMGAGSVALAVFLALNPAWWSAPLRAPGVVIEERRALLDQQIAGAKASGDYHARVGDRIAGLVDQTFFAGAQFYEVPAWSDYISGEIAAYNDSWLSGRRATPAWGAALMLALAAGVIALGWRWRARAAWIVLWWLAGTAVALLIAVPLNWQRYYLPVYAPVSVAIGVGIGWIGTQARRRTYRNG